MSGDTAPGREEPGVESLTSLEGLSSGRFIVTTCNGTRHLVDLDERTVLRRSAGGREWDRHGMGFGPITPDGLPMRLIHLSGARVGEHMRVANHVEWRLSSTVLSIEHVRPLSA